MFATRNRSWRLALRDRRSFHETTSQKKKSQTQISALNGITMYHKNTLIVSLQRWMCSANQDAPTQPSRSCLFKRAGGLFLIHSDNSKWRHGPGGLLSSAPLLWQTSTYFQLPGPKNKYLLSANDHFPHCGFSNGWRRAWPIAAAVIAADDELRVAVRVQNARKGFCDRNNAVRLASEGHCPPKSWLQLDWKYSLK